ncbi:hypothetical protein ACFSCV_10865 [Methylopila henanensis]|uniref:Alpha/beta hydrolase n=1 Tax=Methylopila henanensis TaxID=873516 RepID=A0ABW4K756_9HYPH
MRGSRERQAEGEEPVLDTSAFGLINETYRLGLRPGRGIGVVINLSSRRSLTLGSVPFPCPVVDVADQRVSYYTTFVDSLIEGLRGFVAANGFQAVCAIGSSKSGFGALLVSRELARALPQVQVSALAFGAQTRLWPPNEAIRFKSYHNLLERAGRRRRILRDLQRFGDVRAPADLPNLRWSVFYGDRHPVDAGEALALAGRSVALKPLPTRLHATILPFLCAGAGRAGVEGVVAAYHGRAASDEDLKASLPSDKEADMVEEILALGPQPGLADLIRDQPGFA